MPALEPPRLDEHRVVVDAPTDAVWAALLDTLDATFSGRPVTTFARAVGCAEPEPSGPRPLAEGSTIAGFRVTEAHPPRRLVLRGRHRFSDYVLAFHLHDTGHRHDMGHLDDTTRLDDATPAATTLTAESRAAFPGPLGRVYRTLVLGSRAHVILVRRLLHTVGAAAEGRTPTPS